MKFFILFLEILLATIAVSIINYLAAKTTFTGIKSVLIFSLLWTPLTILSTFFFSLYYNHSMDIKYGNLILGAYFVMVLCSTFVQYFLLNQPVNPKQYWAFLFMSIGVGILAIK